MNNARASRCIVSLTYDDALPVHFESIAPLLEEHGLRGTFYVPCSPSFFNNVESWREVANQGHELGNHTVFHPCHNSRRADHPYDLGEYSARRWTDEVRLANDVLCLVDGRTVRTFGNTSSHASVGAGKTAADIDSLAPEFFVAARGSLTRNPIDLDNISWFDLGTRSADGGTFKELRDEITRMCRLGGWLVLNMHGVGPRDHRLHIGEDEHTRLVEWLADRQETIWTAPVRVVAEALKPSRRSLVQVAGRA